MTRRFICILLLTIALAAACAPAMPAPSGPEPTATATLAVPSATATSAPTAKEPTPAPPPASPTPAPVITSAPTLTVLAPTATRPRVTATPEPTQQGAPGTPVVDIVVDNRDAGFAYTGSWFVGDGGQSYNGDCHWAPRGVGNIAYYNPHLPVAGSYEVFGWWCGDPHHDQTYEARIYIYPLQGRIVPYQVTADLQQNAGQWVSLGTYYLQTNGSLSIGSSLFGNVVADAFRFVYRSPDDITTTPTPAPTRQIWTNHPPSPLEQLAAGDFSARLGLVQWMYQYSPVVWTWEGDLDDCQAFTRTGCSGQRRGWEAHVHYLDKTYVYYVSGDYRHVKLDAPLNVADRQTLYLMVTKGTWFLRIDRYPDDTWWASSSTYNVSTSASQQPLDAATVAELRRLAEKYNSVQAELADGYKVTFYGLGRLVEFEPEDAAAVERLLAALRVTAVPVE